jgi:hypothetical protein
MELTLMRAKMATMSSTALPRVAFSKPPSVWPRRNAASSVANPSSPAEVSSGRMKT